jgi:hypothetical protein
MADPVWLCGEAAGKVKTYITYMKRENFLLIEPARKYHEYVIPDLTHYCPE